MIGLDVFVQREAAAAIPMLLDRDGRSGPSLDTEARITAIGEGLARCPATRVQTLTRDGSDLDDLLRRVHRPEYLEFLARHDDLGDSPPPLVHAFLAPDVEPDTPLAAGMYSIARGAADCAITAASALGDSRSVAYALCRPPGHHAGRQFLGGYCFLNNAALAARALLDAGQARVAILDLDYHFGNGTADILAESRDTMFVSLHAATDTSYPYQVTRPRGPHQCLIGFAEPPSEADYLMQLEQALHDVVRFGADAVVVSIGFDIVAGDPHGGWQLEPSIFGAIGQLLRGLERPLCLVQEGGYHIDLLPACAHRLASGLTGQTGLPS